MKRIAVILAGLLCFSAVSFAQAPVSSSVALNAAIADVNAKQGTVYTYDGGQVSYTFSEERVTGDNLGCEAVAATNQNAYLVMVTQFDFDFDNVYEWEHRFANETDGSLKMVVCRQPDLSMQPTQAPTATPFEMSATPEGTLEGTLEPTPISPDVIYGRDGARIMPATICGTLPTRLINGSIGRVIPGGAVNNLRQMSDLTSLKIGELAAGEVFTVMDGPMCSGGIAWYLVGDGMTPAGWTAEGVDMDYFLEPQVTDALLIRAENAAQLAAVGPAFGKGAVSISANTPGRLVIADGTLVQVYTPQSVFAPLSSVQWAMTQELALPARWVFSDNVSRLWTLGADNQITAQDLFGMQIPPVALADADQPFAVDGESNFVALGTANGVDLYQLGQNGALNDLILTLPADGDVLDVAFTSEGMSLFVLTPDLLTVYRFVLGEGWTANASQSVPVDMQLGTITVDESGSRVAIAGTNDDGGAAIRVVDGLLDDGVLGEETILEYNAAADVALLSPSFNADGSLVAAFATDDSVVLLDTMSGEAISMDTGAETGVSGAVAFSRDGLLLWVSHPTTGVQAYAVAAK